MKTKLTQGILALMGALALIACSPAKESARRPASLGAPSDAILGGVEVTPNDPIAASTVGIIKIDDEGRGGVVCTGTLVTGNMVLTAAHCTVENPQHLLILFSNKVPQNSEEVKTMQIRRVLVGKTSPLWPQLTKEKKKNWGDIALLRFGGELPPNYKPATVLSNPQTLQNGQDVTLAGFGYTDGLNKTKAKELHKVAMTLTEVAVTETEMGFDQRAAKGACHGDSGGPAFLTSNGQPVLIGVTSRGSVDADGKDSCTGYSIYTNVTSYIDWIKQTVTELNQATTVFPIPQPNLPKDPEDEPTPVVPTP